VTLIEGWAKAIGAGARVIIHREKSSFDFLKGEGAGESGSLGGVDSGRCQKKWEVEVAGSPKGGTQKVFEKGVKDRGFSRVRGGEIAIIGLQAFNLILLEAPRSAEVEVAGILIAESAIFYLRPLSPVGGPLKVFLAEVVFGKGTKAGL
jgi:hypothetical protein